MASARLIRNLFPLIGALLLCIVAVTAIKTRLIDEDGEESIAQTVCGRTQDSFTQIASFETIKNLFAYLENLPPGHKLETCRNNHRAALKLLVDINSVRNDNVCRDDKISLIEKFHHTYISKTKKDKEQQKLDNTLEAPKILKNFFYHHAMKVATMCKNTLIAERYTITNLEGSSITKVDSFLKEFSRQLGSNSGSFKTYDEISLFWNYIDKLPIRENSSYISQEGERISVEASKWRADSMKAFQRESLKRLKPVYGRSVLPVIRLIDLGYYLDDEPLASKLAKRDDLRRLIGVAQVCEFILPIRIIANEKSVIEQMNLLTKKQASEIPHDDENGNNFEPVVIRDDYWNSLWNSFFLDTLDSATPDGAHRFVKSVSRNIKAREITLRSLFSKMANSLMGKAKSMFGKIFYKSKGQGENGELDVMKNPGFGLNGRKSSWTISKEGLASDFTSISNANKFTMIFVIVCYLIKWIFQSIVTLFKGILYVIFAVVALPYVRARQPPQPNGLYKKIFDE